MENVALFAARQAGAVNYYTYNLEEPAKEPPFPVQLTSSRKPKGSGVFTPDSKSVFYLEDGSVMTSPVESPKPKPLAINAEMDVDFNVEKVVATARNCFASSSYGFR